MSPSKSRRVGNGATLSEGEPMRKMCALSFALVLALLAVVGVTGCDTSTTTPSKQTSPPSTVATVKHTTQEQLIYDYYKAINNKQYETAWAITTANFKSHYPTLADFKASYADYVSSVTAVSVKKLDQFSTPQKEEYETAYDATYIKQYPAGSGYLPTINVLVPDPAHTNKWLLDEIGTGP
jgi:hypothetical protein